MRPGYQLVAVVAAVSLVGQIWGQNQKVTPEYLRQLRVQRVQNPDQFFYDFSRPVKITQGPGGSLRTCGIEELPTLAGMGIAVSLVDLKACAINNPHIHPRATEFSFISKAPTSPMMVGVVEENEGRTLGQPVSAGSVTLFPHAMVHFEFNPSCEDQQFIAAFSSDDPGTETSTFDVLSMPTEAIANALRLTIAEADALVRKQIPGTGPRPGEPECRRRCGLQPTVF
ncbi:Cupin type-1 domain-containing protein [Plasmodiophora brassicae]